ncbi:MAG: hypothetical protein GXO74_14135 [Calditrichaeota bacterium]|nr:hypothetical protein [Calditrichota bacterium]
MNKILLTILLIPVCAVAQSEFQFNLFEKTATVVFDSTKAAYALPDSFLMPFSEKIFSDSLMLEPGSDYRIDYVQGVVSFVKKFPHGKILNISYQILPLPLQKKYYHRLPAHFSFGKTNAQTCSH